MEKISHQTIRLHVTTQKRTELESIRTHGRIERVVTLIWDSLVELQITANDKPIFSILPRMIHN